MVHIDLVPVLSGWSGLFVYMSVYDEMRRIWMEAVYQNILYRIQTLDIIVAINDALGLP